MAHTLQDKLSEKLEEGISSSISATLSDKDDLTADEIAALSPAEFVVVPYDDAEAERTGYSNYSYWGSTIRMFFKNKVAVTMLIIMVALGYVGADEGNQAWEVAVRMRYLVAGTFLFSALLQFVGLGLVYNLDKKTMEQMNAELEARHNAN